MFKFENNQMTNWLLLSASDQLKLLQIFIDILSAKIVDYFNIIEKDEIGLKSII